MSQSLMKWKHRFLTYLHTNYSANTNTKIIHNTVQIQIHNSYKLFVNH